MLKATVCPSANEIGIEFNCSINELFRCGKVPEHVRHGPTSTYQRPAIVIACLRDDFP